MLAKGANSSIRNFVIETNYERVILEAELANGDNEIDDGIRARLSSTLARLTSTAFFQQRRKAMKIETTLILIATLTCIHLPLLAFIKVFSMTLYERPS